MVQDFGDYVVVEGDIIIPKAQLHGRLPYSSNGPLEPRFQYRMTSWVGTPKVQQITVNLTGLSAHTAWQTAAREAMGHWNSIPGSYVRMVEVTSGGDISVSPVCFNGISYVAVAAHPSGGNPGSYINVISCPGFNFSNSQRVWIMAHEFGHTLGLRHTNWQSLGEPASDGGAVHIPGTPTGNDPGSVMNVNLTAYTSWAGFSAADQQAVRTLYPLPWPTGLGSSNSSGKVVVSWSPVIGASYYQVQRVEERTYADYMSNLHFTNTYPEGWSPPVYGTSVNTGSTWTGASYCHWQTGMGLDEFSDFYYEVVAVFPNGVSVFVPNVPSRDATC